MRRHASWGWVAGLLVVLGLGLLATSPAHAQTAVYTWSNNPGSGQGSQWVWNAGRSVGSYDWTKTSGGAAAEWPAAASGGTATMAVFTSAAGTVGSISVAPSSASYPVTAYGLIFNDGANDTLTTGDLTLSPTNNNTVAAGVTVNGSADVAINTNSLKQNGTQGWSWTTAPNAQLTVGAATVSSGGYGLTLADSGTITVSSTINNTPTMTMAGTGTLNFNGSLASSDSLILSAGTTNFGSAASVGTLDLSTGSPLVGTSGGGVAITAEAKLPGGSILAGVFSMSGSNLAGTTVPHTVTLAGGTVTATGPATATPFNSPTTAVTVTSATTLTTGGTAPAANFGALTIAGAPLTLAAIQPNTPFTFPSISCPTTGSVQSDATGNAQLVIGTGGAVAVSAGQTLTIGAAVVDGTSATTLVKTGPGTLTLSGSNTYGGGTSINAGSLVVNGSLGNTAVTVGGGATLGGTGSIAGTVVVIGGSTAGTQGAINLADGMIGTLTLSDPNAADTVLTLGGPTAGNLSVLTFEVGAIADRIRVAAGKVAVNPGGSLINITALSGFGPGTYDLLDFPTNQASGLGYLSLATTSLEGYALSLQSTPTSEQLVVAVPEPGTLALLAAAAACGLAVWRRSWP